MHVTVAEVEGCIPITAGDSFHKRVGSGKGKRVGFGDFIERAKIGAGTLSSIFLFDGNPWRYPLSIGFYQSILPDLTLETGPLDHWTAGPGDLRA